MAASAPSAKPASTAPIISDSSPLSALSCWWSSLTDECPITLEPLSTLPYPPFALYSERHGDDRPYYFDGLALASYAVSRGTFQNPLTREPLTRKDCRRLDAYLDEHCYRGRRNDGGDGANDARPGDGGGGGVGRRICVTEAFALRESVRVRAAPGGGGGSAASASLSESRRLRAEALRGEAAAALRCLFVFGHRPGPRRPLRAGLSTERGGGGGDGDGAQAVPLLGFNLHGRPRRGDAPDADEDADGGAAVLEVEGLRIVDDDAEIADSAEDAAWRDLSDAFPRLSAVAGGDDGDDGGMENGTASLTATSPVDDPHSGALLQTARQVAERTRVEEEERFRLRERCRARLIVEAMQRKDERMRRRKEEKERRHDVIAQVRKENEDIARARKEIESWRAQQWEQMVRATEAARRREEEEVRRKQEVENEASGSPVTSGKNDDKEKDSKEEEKAAAAAAKKAAKRRRAKKRQKVKKVAERAEAERRQKLEAIKKKKEASSFKCGACGEGILDCGFERLGVKFCSTKCARSGPVKSC